MERIFQQPELVQLCTWYTVYIVILQSVFIHSSNGFWLRNIVSTTIYASFFQLQSVNSCEFSFFIYSDLSAWIDKEYAFHWCANPW